MKKFITIFLLLILLTGGLLYLAHVFTKVESGEIEIFHGATPKQIGGILEQHGIIKNGDVFYYYIRLKQEYYKHVKKEPNAFVVAFKEGKFTIKPGRFDDLIKQLNEDGLVEQKYQEVTFPEGSTLTDMANTLEESGLVSANEFLVYTNDKSVYENLRNQYDWLPELDRNVYHPLEGYLHANTYHLPLDATAETVVKMMLEETNKWYAKNKVQVDRIIDRTHLTSFNDVVTLASIVERESMHKEDRPKVAQVFFNRLKAGMKLESDVTVSYGNREHKVFMYYKDVEKESPYNTYLLQGLPAGPIASPSLSSLEAVIKPAGEEFDAIYFYSRPNGKIYYAKTFDEHEQNRKKFEHEWKELEKK